MGQESSLKQQVKKKLMEYIQSMDLEKGNRLPSEEKLSTMFGVSRVTIRSALKELEMEGRIFSRHGSGTYVNPMARRIAFNLAVPELYENIIRKAEGRPMCGWKASSRRRPGKKPSHHLACHWGRLWSP